MRHDATRRGHGLFGPPATVPGPWALRALWIAAALMVAGRLVDARWHSTHEEFEGALEQAQAHWLAWLGALVALAVAILVLQGSATATRGYMLTLAGGLLYGGVAVWHFIEHASGNDPGGAHLLLVIGQLAIFAGVVIATVETRGSRRPRHAGGTPSGKGAAP